MEERGELFTAILDYSADGTDPAFKNPLLRMAWAIVRRDIDRDSDKYQATVKRRKYAAYCKVEKEAGRIPLRYDEWEIWSNDETDLTPIDQTAIVQASASTCTSGASEGDLLSADSANGSTCNQINTSESKKKRVRTNATKRIPTSTSTSTSTTTSTPTPTPTSTPTPTNNISLSSHTDDISSVDKSRNGNGPKKSSGFVRPTLEEVRAYCQERNKGVNPETFYNYYDANGWKFGRIAMKDWKAAIRYWETNGIGDKMKTSAGGSVPGSFLDMPQRPGNYFIPTEKSMSVDEYNARAKPEAETYDDFNMEQELNSIFGGDKKHAAK